MSLQFTTNSWFDFVFIECIRLVRELNSFQISHPRPYQALTRVLGSITIGESTYNVISLAQRIANRQIVLSKLEYIQVGNHMVSHLGSIYRAISYFGSTLPAANTTTSSSSSTSLIEGSNRTRTTNSSEDSVEDASNESCS